VDLRSAWIGVRCTLMTLTRRSWALTHGVWCFEAWRLVLVWRSVHDMVCWCPGVAFCYIMVLGMSSSRYGHG
jgi:hypothetical protein